MKINFKHIAQLAKLWFDESEIPGFEKDMGAMLEMVDNLPEIGDDGYILDPSAIMALRPDVIAESLPRDELLSNAPQKQAECIVVPKTV